MSDLSPIDYSMLDRPEMLMFLFHPRQEWAGARRPGPTADMLIPVEDGVEIDARFHIVTNTATNLLFFHGNGEIVSDYDDLGPVYNQVDINFLPVDYRGYGRSTGKPTVTHMMRDCAVIYKFVRRWLENNGCTGPFVVMGRSLGSASAIELASLYNDEIDGLIVESGFAFAEPLLRRLGIDTQRLGFREEVGFRNVDKIRKYDRPTLIIHAEHDHIIPYSDGVALHDASNAAEKWLVKIPGANHNDIFVRGFVQYLAAMKDFVEKLSDSVSF